MSKTCILKVKDSMAVFEPSTELAEALRQKRTLTNHSTAQTTELKLSHDCIINKTSAKADRTPQPDKATPHKQQFQ